MQIAPHLIAKMGSAPPKLFKQHVDFAAVILAADNIVVILQATLIIVVLVAMSAGMV